MVASMKKRLFLVSKQEQLFLLRVQPSIMQPDRAEALQRIKAAGESALEK